MHTGDTDYCFVQVTAYQLAQAIDVRRTPGAKQDALSPDRGFRIEDWGHK